MAARGAQRGPLISRPSPLVAVVEVPVAALLLVVLLLVVLLALLSDLVLQKANKASRAKGQGRTENRCRRRWTQGNHAFTIDKLGGVAGEECPRNRTRTR